VGIGLLRDERADDMAIASQGRRRGSTEAQQKDEDLLQASVPQVHKDRLLGAWAGESLMP
jgi:hypothetical protein